MDRRVEILPTRADVESAVAGALVKVITDAIVTRGRADIVVTGGTVGIGTLAAVRSARDVSEVDWSLVHVWWGDERFVPAGHPDRNEGQARAALFEHIDIPSTNLHTFPAEDGQPLEMARDAFAAIVDSQNPRFDVVLNGIGPDGHVASLFPGQIEPDTDALVVAVSNSPKPPAQRLSLSLWVLNSTERVWIFAAGEEKAQAVANLFGHEDVMKIPASGLEGRLETLVYIDEAAASKVF